MGRIAREWLLYDGCYAHVFTRAIERRRIFESVEDYDCIRKKMIEVKNDYKFKILHYCIMQTHLRMVVEITSVSMFSEGMKVLKKAYTHHYNSKNKRFGAVWRDRYKAKLIENENYMYACGRYVENNPVEAGMVLAAVDWPYSSSRFYEQALKDDVIDPRDISNVDVNLKIDDKDFEGEDVLGSDWFRYQIRKKIKG